MGDGWPSSSLPYGSKPWNFTEDVIYLIKNTPQYDDLVLIIIDEPYPNGYDDDKDLKGDNNEDA